MYTCSPHTLMQAQGHTDTGTQTGTHADMNTRVHIYMGTHMDTGTYNGTHKDMAQMAHMGTHAWACTHTGTQMGTQS